LTKETIHVIVVKLGTTAALDQVRPSPTEAPVPVPLDGKRVVTIVIRDDEDLTSRMRTIAHPDGVWVRHSSSWPEWVESDDPDIESELAAHYNCPVGRPDDDWIE
jgi:hypothetical protein